MKTLRFGGILSVAFAATAMSLPSAVVAATPAAHDDLLTIDVFEGMKRDQIEVRVVMQNENKGRVLVRNKTDQPINVRLPDVMATVPVLAQIGGGAGGGQAGGVGGGIGGGGGGGGGIFNIAPEKVGKFDVIGLCLEHGKPSPNSSMKYTLVPIDEYSNDTKLHELLRLYMQTGPKSAPIFQAAAWHLANGMSWQELASKQRNFLGGRPSEPYFSAAQIRLAFQATELAKKRAEEQTSPGESATKTASAK